MSFRPTRRDVLKAGAMAGIGATLSSEALLSALTADAACNTSLKGIQHVVFLVQENRSFDNYFGAYKGVHGFGDMVANPALFNQAYAQTGTGFANPLQPWHLDTAFDPTLGLRKQGVCTNDVEHQWAGQHDSWNGGLCNNWMNAHLSTDASAKQAALTMAYYQRSDLPFYYALADNFTVCDRYFSSVIGGTDINRLYAMTGTCDPDGWDGGCQFLDTKIGTIESPGADLGSAGRWKPYPQKLTEAGISWKCYGTADGQTGDNPLRYFKRFRPGMGDPALFAPAFGSQALADFFVDCAAGTLPAVSWVFTGLADTEHPPDPITWGESITHDLLTALVTSGRWSSSALFLTYDENGGFFDHVVPPSPPAGEAGEYLNQSALSATARDEAKTKPKSGPRVDKSGDPIGLGFRVPMIVISPFSRNPTPSGAPLVCSDSFDHTSMLRFVETLTGVRVPDRDPASRVPGLSPWRRNMVGDLTSAFNFAAKPDPSVPSGLVSMVPLRTDPRVLQECITSGTLFTLGGPQPAVADPPVPDKNPNPAASQEPSPAAQRPSGLVGSETAAACILPTSAAGSAGALPAARPGGRPPGLPGTSTGGPIVAEVALGAAIVAGAWWSRRRAAAREDPAS